MGQQTKKRLKQINSQDWANDSWDEEFQQGQISMLGHDSAANKLRRIKVSPTGEVFVTGSVEVSNTLTVTGTVAVSNMLVEPLDVSAATVTVDAVAFDIRPLTFAVDAVTAHQGGTWSVTVVGDAAHDAVDAGNPVKIGGRARAAKPTAVGENDRVDAWFDLNGRLGVNASRIGATDVKVDDTGSMPSTLRTRDGPAGSFAYVNHEESDDRDDGSAANDTAIITANCPKFRVVDSESSNPLNNLIRTYDDDSERILSDWINVRRFHEFAIALAAFSTSNPTRLELRVFTRFVTTAGFRMYLLDQYFWPRRDWDDVEGIGGSSNPGISKFYYGRCPVEWIAFEIGGLGLAADKTFEILEMFASFKE